MPIMKKSLIIWILLLFPVWAMAQHAHDTIYLNNGNIVEGVIVSANDAKVSIQTRSGEVLTYDRITIRKIDNGEETARTPRVPHSRYRNYTAVTRGFWGAVEVSGGCSADHDPAIQTVVPVELQLTGGYRFNEFIQVGVGVGFRNYIDNAKARYYINSDGDYEADYGWAFPIYVNARGLFLSDQSRTAVPYWSVSMGHTINDGFLFSPTFGLRIGSRERHHFLLGLGYTAQYTRLKAVDTPYKYGCLSLLQLKLGYQF